MFISLPILFNFQAPVPSEVFLFRRFFRISAPFGQALLRSLSIISSLSLFVNMFFTLSKDFLRCPALALQFILFCDSLSILPHTSPFVNPFFLITPLFGILYGFKSDKISLFVFFVLYPFLDFTQYKHYNVSNFIILIKESRSLEEKMWALKAAFPHTIPVLTGFLILGAAYGILMSQAGYSWFWTVLTCTFVFAGSMQFLSVGLLPFGFHPYLEATCRVT